MGSSVDVIDEILEGRSGMKSKGWTKKLGSNCVTKESAPYSKSEKGRYSEISLRRTPCKRGKYL